MNLALKQKLANLSPTQRAELLKTIKKTTSAEVVEVVSMITPDAQQRYQPFALTEIQQAYFIGRQGGFELGNVSARGYSEIRCDDLDLERLKQAWNGTIKRHSMLRAIVQNDGQQVVQPQVPDFVIKIRDYSALAPTELEAELTAVRDDMSHRVLPADQWPLFEMEATLLPQGKTLLHIGIDVLIFDAWSYDILNWELQLRYQQQVQLPALLPELDLDFRDYVLALKASESQSEYEQAKSYWLERIKTLPGAPQLPLATDPKLIKQPRFERCKSRLNKDRWLRFKALAGEAGVTPSVAMLTIYTDVLASWCKNPHFSLNLTLFNRQDLHPQINDIIGDFTNLVIVEVGKEKGLNFTQRARSIQKQLWQDMDHRAFSGVSVLRELARHWGLFNQPVMPVVFTSAVGHAMPDSEGVHFTWLGEEVYSITQTPQIWLDHQVYEDGDELVFDWDYVKGLFPEDMIEAMFERYCDQLMKLTEDSLQWQAMATDHLPKPMTAQRHQNTLRDIGQQQCLHHGFLQQVFCNADNLAVTDGDSRISYGDLYHYSRALADTLVDAGLNPGELVGVSANKDWTQIAAVLAVLQAGGAYLPLDPELPSQRLAYILDKSQARIVIDAWPGQHHSCESSAKTSGEKNYPDTVQVLGMPTVTLSDPLPPRLPERAQPGDLAYVIFTSGSTGQPKGVMIEHQAAMNTICDINQRFGITTNDKVLALSALSFDLSVYDIFGFLAVGGSLVLPSLEHLRDPQHWTALLLEHQVTIWNTAPALMEMLTSFLEGSKQPLPQDIRVIMMSGDWIPVTLPKRIKTIARHEVAVNSLGGATEGSIWSIIYPVDTDCSALNSIPYGKGMVNQDVQVLDGDYRQKPDWVAGDLYITGLGVAKGYLGEPEKTEAAFIKHPQSGEPMYRTGDLGRYLPDGNIEFLGREDFQVKVHGFRIELGEIESLLAQHPDIAQVVVDVHGKPQNRRLAAWIVWDDGHKTRPLAGFELLEDPAQRFKFRTENPGIRVFDHPEVVLDGFGANPDDSPMLQQRQTMRCFSEQNVSLVDFQRLLQQVSAVQGEQLAKYRYGSSGSLYPVRCYLYIASGRIEGVPGGSYYFNPQSGQLVMIKADVVIGVEAHAPANRQGFAQSAFSIYLVGKSGAIAPLYGDMSHHFCVLEAGLMTQVLEETAATIGLGLCQIGAMNYAPVNPHLALDDDEEILHSLFGGMPDVQANAEFYQQQPSESDHKKAGLMTYLRQYLPEYMIPSEFLAMDKLPLTSNGKVDRKALPVIDDEEKDSSRVGFVAPQSELENHIADIWKSVLGKERLSIYDNFFDVGGNSVHMVQIHSRLQDIDNIPTNLIDLFFRFPTIDDLVRFLTKDTAAGTAQAAAAQIDDEEKDKLLQRRQAKRTQRRVRQPNRDRVQATRGDKK